MKHVILSLYVITMFASASLRAQEHVSGEGCSIPPNCSPRMKSMILAKWAKLESSKKASRDLKKALEDAKRIETAVWTVNVPLATVGTLGGGLSAFFFGGAAVLTGAVTPQAVPGWAMAGACAAASACSFEAGVLSVKLTGEKKKALEKMVEDEFKNMGALEKELADLQSEAACK